MTFGKIFKRKKVIDLTMNKSMRKIMNKNMQIRKSKNLKKKEAQVITTI